MGNKSFDNKKDQKNQGLLAYVYFYEINISYGQKRFDNKND